MGEFGRGRRGVDAAQLFAGSVRVEQPLDAGTLDVSSSLPVRDLTLQGSPVFNSVVQALPAQEADFDFYHVELTRMLGHEVKLQSPVKTVAGAKDVAGVVAEAVGEGVLGLGGEGDPVHEEEDAGDHPGLRRGA